MELQPVRFFQRELSLHLLKKYRMPRMTSHQLNFENRMWGKLKLREPLNVVLFFLQ
ncbi:MAG: hypothetical protein M1303_09045 [Bacteroidetes bacterium]|nr:hypothetical protein [Bacteroidota bacterium]